MAIRVGETVRFFDEQSGRIRKGILVTGTPGRAGIERSGEVGEVEISGNGVRPERRSVMFTDPRPDIIQGQTFDPTQQSRQRIEPTAAERELQASLLPELRDLPAEDVRRRISRVPVTSFQQPISPLIESRTAPEGVPASFERPEIIKERVLRSELEQQRLIAERAGQAFQMVAPSIPISPIFEEAQRDIRQASIETLKFTGRTPAELQRQRAREVSEEFGETFPAAITAVGMQPTETLPRLLFGESPQKIAKEKLERQLLKETEVSPEGFTSFVIEESDIPILGLSLGFSAGAGAAFKATGITSTLARLGTTPLRRFGLQAGVAGIPTSVSVVSPTEVPILAPEKGLIFTEEFRERPAFSVARFASQFALTLPTAEPGFRIGERFPLRAARITAPTPSGEITVFKGVVGEFGQRATGLGISQGEITRGIPTIRDVDIIPGVGTIFQPSGVFETKLFFEKGAEAVFTRPTTKLVEGRIVSPELQQRLSRTLLGLERETVSLEGVTPTLQTIAKGSERLSEPAALDFLKFLKEEKGILFGSGATQAQVLIELRRTTGDFDVKFPGATKKELEDLAEKAAERLSEFGDFKAEGTKVKVFKEGKYQKAIEFKGKEPEVSGEIQPQAKALGFDTTIEGTKTIKVGGVKAAALSGEAKRKLAGVLRLTDTGEVGVPHIGRFKDLPDLFAIKETQIKVKLKENINVEQRQQLLKRLKQLENLRTELKIKLPEKIILNLDEPSIVSKPSFAPSIARTTAPSTLTTRKESPLSTSQLSKEVVSTPSRISEKESLLSKQSSLSETSRLSRISPSTSAISLSPSKAFTAPSSVSFTQLTPVSVISTPSRVSPPSRLSTTPITSPPSIPPSLQPPSRLPPSRLSTTPVTSPRDREFEKERNGLRQAYDVLIRRGKRFIKEEGGLPRNRALAVGTTKVEETLAATFRLVPKGRTKQKDIDFQVPGDRFRLPKKGSPLDKPDTYVERRNKRLSTRTEVGEIQKERKGSKAFKTLRIGRL